MERTHPEGPKTVPVAPKAMYPLSNGEWDRLNNTFTYHAPFGTQQERYVGIRETGKLLAVVIMENAPPSRERSLALTKIEEATMWANAAIARNEVQVRDVAQDEKVPEEPNTHAQEPEEGVKPEPESCASAACGCERTREEPDYTSPVR